MRSTKLKILLSIVFGALAFGAVNLYLYWDYVYWHLLVNPEECFRDPESIVVTYDFWSWHNKDHCCQVKIRGDGHIEAISIDKYQGRWTYPGKISEATLRELIVHVTAPELLRTVFQRADFTFNATSELLTISDGTHTKQIRHDISEGISLYPIEPYDAAINSIWMAYGECVPDAFNRPQDRIITQNFWMVGGGEGLFWSEKNWFWDDLAYWTSGLIAGFAMFFFLTFYFIKEKSSMGTAIEKHK